MKYKKPILITIGVIIVLILIGGGIFWSRLSSPIDETQAPKIVKAHALAVADLEGISKFRSGAGHDFSGLDETCRSMKHYFMPAGFTAYNQQHYEQQSQGEYLPPAPTAETAVNVYSPIAGTITKIQSEQYPIGKQIHIRSTEEPDITFRLFHVYPSTSLAKGSQVTAGQLIGEISRYQQTDIAVQLMTRRGPQFLSYFQMMPDSLLADFAEQGIKNRGQLIITREQRDASPLTCQGEQFTQQNSQNDWVLLP